MALAAETLKTELRRHIIRMYLPGEDPSNLPDDLPLQESGVLTSINMLELVDHIEDSYSVSLSAHDIATRFESIGDIAALVIERAGASG